MISDGYETNGDQLKVEYYRAEKAKERSSKKVNFPRIIPIISRTESCVSFTTRYLLTRNENTCV